MGEAARRLFHASADAASAAPLPQHVRRGADGGVQGGAAFDGTYLLPVCTQFESSGSRVARMLTMPPPQQKPIAPARRVMDLPRIDGTDRSPEELQPLIAARDFATITKNAADFLAIVQAMNNKFALAASAVFAAMVFDALDGQIARMTGSAGKFGEQLDSLSDMVSFGAAPALVMYEWALKPMGKWGWAAAFICCACAAICCACCISCSKFLRSSARAIVFWR